MSKTVYLAGPISGHSFQGATDWRDYAKQFLAELGIDGLDPMRGKSYLKDMQDLDKNCIEYGKINVMSSPKGILTRDRFDATRCDILLANFLDSGERVSIGTVMEVAWADLCRTPIIAVMQEDNVHSHAMMTESIGFRVDSLDEGLQLAAKILL